MSNYYPPDDEVLALDFYTDPRPNPKANTKGKVGRDHPSTSRKAALMVAPKTGTQRDKLLSLLIAEWPEGLTDEEMQRMLRLGPNSETPRRLELVEGLWIEDSGERRPTLSGSTAIVWRYIPRHRGES